MTLINSWVPNQFLWNKEDDSTLSVGITVDQGASVLREGTILGAVTANGNYQAYNAANIDGTSQAVYILGECVDPRNGPVNTVGYKRGTFVAANLIGFDEGASNDLRGELLHDGRYVIR